MIVLDTNIISELMKPNPNASVQSWIKSQSSHHLYVTSITIAEISYGIDILNKGVRRSFLENAFHHALQESFEQRILNFDQKSAFIYGKLMSNQKKQGKPMSMPDGQIAAITLTHNAKLATRNTVDFLIEDLYLINPFLIFNESVN